MISWPRKSNSDLEGLRMNWEKIRKEKNVRINEQVFHIAWFTYRKGFNPSFYDNLKTDSGWGCMIRSGQMLLFTVIRRLINLPPFSIIRNYNIINLKYRKLFFGKNIKRRKNN